MSNQKNFECIQKVKNETRPCRKRSCRHWLESPEKMNCSVIAAEDGPKTLQEIGDYFGISRMRVCQIEKRAIQKLKNLLVN